jgi:hypothetical protein
MFTSMQYCFSHSILVDLVLSRQWMQLLKAHLQLLEPGLDAGPPDETSSSSGGPPHSIILTPIRNNIARVRPKENDPNFDHMKAYKDKGLVYNVYKPVGPFLVELPLAEVKSPISVANSNQRSNNLRQWVTSEIPSHLALTFN